MFSGFKQFLLRGNVVDLAVAVVIGVAFGQIVDGLVTGLINPLIAAVFGEPDLSGVGTFTINNAEFSVGLILDPALNFVLIATAVFFLVVLPLNRLSARLSGGPEPESEDTVLLREIRDLLSQQQQQQIDQR